MTILRRQRFASAHASGRNCRNSSSAAMKFAIAARETATFRRTRGGKFWNWWRVCAHETSYNDLHRNVDGIDRIRAIRKSEPGIRERAVQGCGRGLRTARAKWRVQREFVLRFGQRLFSNARFRARDFELRTRPGVRSTSCRSAGEFARGARCGARARNATERIGKNDAERERESVDDRGGDRGLDFCVCGRVFDFLTPSSSRDRIVDLVVVDLRLGGICGV